MVGGERQAMIKRNRAGAVTAMTTINESCDLGAIKSGPRRMPQERSVFRRMRRADGAIAWKNPASNLDWRSLLYPRAPQFK